MKEKILTTCFVVVSILSCSNPPKDVWKEILLDDEYWWFRERCFPVQLILWGDLSDTICVVTTAHSLFYSMNIRIADRQFPELLYNELKNTGGYLNVNADFFEENKQYVVKPIPEVDSIYAESGINAVLSHYLLPTGELLANSETMDYIIYLCFQHDLHFIISQDDGGVGTFLMRKHDLGETEESN